MSVKFDVNSIFFWTELKKFGLILPKYFDEPMYFNRFLNLDTFLIENGPFLMYACGCYAMSVVVFRQNVIFQGIPTEDTTDKK